MSSPKNAPLLSLRSVVFSYDGTRRVLDGISLDVRPGERVAVLGHNGSGKSTLVRILGALQAPLQGACFISGRDVREIPFEELHAKVGVVFQNPESQIVAAVVEDDVAFAPENQGLPPPEIEERVAWALERVGMAHKRSSPVSALSGGEKQRVALAGALASRAECLVLDEPTAMLDPEGRLEVAGVLRAIHASGTALVQVTHQLECLEDADRILVLSKGRWLWQGDARDFWPDAERLGFELPPLRRLAARLGARGVSVPSPTVEGVTSAVAASLPGRSASSPPPADRPSVPELPALLEVRDLSFRFDAPSPETPLILDGVDALFPRGAWTAVVGRTGSGKSTLVQHLNGLYKVQSGRILIEGSPLPQAGEDLHRLRRRVGLVFQTPEDQLFCPTVREELSFAPANAGFEDDRLEQAVRSAISDVGLNDDFLLRNPLALSGGERRLVAIASVLAADPECLILDEPTAGLDAAYRRRILCLLSDLRRCGRTVITITHDLEMAFGCCDRLLVMDSGRTVGEGGVGTALPLLMQALSSPVWPEVLQVSDRLRARCGSVPLTWDPDVLLRAIETAIKY
nr:energy-coupling factor transporter ATPase [uncultured Fretibacterium sp.]